MDTRIVAPTLMLFGVCVTPMLEALAKPSTCVPGGPFDPAKPASAGYSLVFSDDFTNPQTVDLDATGNASFNWYLAKFFGYGTEPASTVAFTPDGLVLMPASPSGNYNIATAAPANNTGAMSGPSSAAGPISRRRSSSTQRRSISRKGFLPSGAFPSSMRQIWEPITPVGRPADSNIS
jgi:hypothetical protein